MWVLLTLVITTSVTAVPNDPWKCREVKFKDMSALVVEVVPSHSTYPFSHTQMVAVSFGEHDQLMQFTKYLNSSMPLFDMLIAQKCVSNSTFASMLLATFHGLALYHGLDAQGLQLTGGITYVEVNKMVKSLFRLRSDSFMNAFFIETPHPQLSYTHTDRGSWTFAPSILPGLYVYAVQNMHIFHSAILETVPMLPRCNREGFLNEEPASPDHMCHTCPRPSFHVPAAATGEFYYIEERPDLRAAMQGSVQTGAAQRLSVNGLLPLDLETEGTDDIIEVKTNGVVLCYMPELAGLLEFCDFEANPMRGFYNPYVHSPGHDDVTGLARFAFLDARGARLQHGQLIIIFDENNSKFILNPLRHGESGVERLSMYYESSSFGIGYGDSGHLSPPMPLHAVPLQWARSEIQRLAHLTPPGCFCDNTLRGVHFVIGLAHYPQYGHVLFNGLSNVLATLWLYNIERHDVVLHIQLERNQTTPVLDGNVTHYLPRHEQKYKDLFAALGFKSVHHWADTIAWSRDSHYSACFERILIGSKPLLDHLNTSSPAYLWKRFADTVFDALVKAETAEMFMGAVGYDHANIVAHTLPYRQCAVTFIQRLKTFRYTSRYIINIDDLVDAAREFGCTTQVVYLQQMPISDQIAQLRLNTSLLVGVDGTGLLNAVFNHVCSGVLRISMWRKPGIVRNLSPGMWLEYAVALNETVWVEGGKSGDGVMRWLQNLNDTHSMEQMNVLYFGEGPHPNVLVEDYLREGQGCVVNLQKFRDALREVEAYRVKCMADIHGS